MNNEQHNTAPAPSGSVDSPKFRYLLEVCVRAGLPFYKHHAEPLIDFINAWSDERCNTAINQLAASGAVVPSLTDALNDLAAVASYLDKVDAPQEVRERMKAVGTLAALRAAPAGYRKALYMAAIDCGHTITDGKIVLERDQRKEGNALKQLADRLDAAVTARFRAEGGNTNANSAGFATPVAGWVSVEDEHKPKPRTPVLLFVRTLTRGTDDEGGYREQEGAEVAMGEFRKRVDGLDYFDCYTSPMSDNDWVTHWMPLPPAPVATPTQQQEQP